MNFRVGMNMPIFFVISGYFAWRAIEAGDWGKLAQGLRSYFQPALFAGLVFTGVGLLMGLVDSSTRAIAMRLAKSVFVDPWFITTLAECYVITFVATAVGRRTKWGLVILVAIWLAVVCRPEEIPGRVHFGCLVSMLPHYVFGAIVLKRLNRRVWENWRIGVLCLSLFIAFVLLEGDVAVNGMSFYTADSTARAFWTLRGAMTFVLRPLVGLLGSIGVMWCVWMLIKIAPFFVCFAKIGTLTLGIYIFHLWPLERLRGIAWIGSSAWSVSLTSIVGLAFFSLLTWLLMEKTGRFKKWIWGK